MKKLFIVLAVATFTLGFVACNNEASEETPAFDSVAYKDSVAKAVADSLAALPAPDSTSTPDSAK